MVESLPEKSRLEALDDRRRNVRIAPRDRKHSTYVSRLRWVLPAVVLGMVGMLMIWPKIQIEISERRFAPSKLDKAALEAAATQNKLLNANFSSVDSKGRPFTLTATEAVQDNNNPDNITLQSPHGTLKISDTDTMTAQSLTGLYAQGEQHLTLIDDVVLTRSDGTTMNTEKLFVNLKTNDSHTDQPVVIDGPQGHLTAKGMDVKEDGAVTIFPGPAKLIINNTKSSIDPKGNS